MKKINLSILAVFLCLLFTQCSDYLNTSSPSNSDDDFVTSTPSETFKALSWCYANYRQNCAISLYNWNDVIGSDSEMYPEASSTNNMNAIMQPENIPIDAMRDPFNNLYSTLARATRIAKIISEKSEFKSDVASGKVTDWTQLYGEALTIRAFCYFNLVRHYGDVPYGYENSYVDNYSLTSRFDIYDDLIASLNEAIPLMYTLGEKITAERLSKTFANALIGQIALNAGGYQTIRTDMPELYGNVQFTKKGKEEYNSVYARRTDYLDYYKIAEQYLQAAIDTKGSAYLITSDGRSYANNPFQRHFQYMHDLTVSPESLFEIGNIQGGQSGQTTTSDYPYNFGRPSNGGGSNSAPCKVFAGTRIIPTFYYGEYDNNDKRRDVSATVTGSKGDGNEAILSFKPGSKLEGGISLNKWDDNRMSPPYSSGQRNSGINYPILRFADVILMLAETKAELSKDMEAISLVNQIRERAFGNTNHNITNVSGEALKEAILQERKLEFFGEATRRWDLIRSGKFSEKAITVRKEMKTMITNLRTQGYHKFVNGNVISNYIFTKNIRLENPLTYDCTDTNNPILYPGWRGQYNWSTSSVSGKVKGTDHNVAIKGLFNYIDPNGLEASNLLSEGYQLTDWAIEIVNNETSYDRNILSGIKSSEDPPRYFYPIPFETISKSKGNITNGYGLAQQ